MKNTVKISSVVFGATVESNGFQIQLVNINLVDTLQQFKVNDDGDKELRDVRQLTVRMSEFSRILVLDDMLALVDETELSEDQNQLSDKEKLSIRFHNQTKLLKGAMLVVERKEVLEEEEEDEEENKEENSEKEEKKIIGFESVKFTKLTLTPAAAKLAEKLVFAE